MPVISGVPGSALRTFVSGRRVCATLLETKAHNKTAVADFVMIAPETAAICAEFYRNGGTGQSNWYEKRPVAFALGDTSFAVC
jgi:hypothetical protein